MEYPGSWEEMTDVDKTIGVCGVLFRCFVGEMSIELARKLIADVLLNRRNNWRKPEAGAVAWDYWANEARIAETVNFVFERKEVKRKGKKEIQFHINPSFFNQLIQKYKGLNGPVDLFGGLTFGEFKDANVAMLQFAEHKDVVYLDRLAAILYSPRQRFAWVRRVFTGSFGRRAKYNQGRMERSLRIMEGAPVGFKFYCFLYFAGCMNFIRNEEIEIDGKRYYMGCLFNGSGGDSKDDTGLTGVLFSMAESGVFGNIEKTAGAALFDVLLRLYQVHKQVESIKVKKK